MNLRLRRKGIERRGELRRPGRSGLFYSMDPDWNVDCIFSSETSESQLFIALSLRLRNRCYQWQRVANLKRMQLSRVAQSPRCFRTYLYKYEIGSVSDKEESMHRRADLHLDACAEESQSRHAAGRLSHYLLLCSVQHKFSMRITSMSTIFEY